jgi:myo-inositol-1(or 4)-monophosphatase
LERATAGTTAPELYRSDSDQAAFQRLRSKLQLMRYGGDAYFFAMVAGGHMDIAMDAGLQAYDIMPLIPVIEGAGGCVAEWTGGNPAQGGNILAAGSRQLLDEALAIMQA